MLKKKRGGDASQGAALPDGAPRRKDSAPVLPAWAPRRKDSAPVLPTWAPRVKPYLIVRLYESDAAGLRDDALLDQVGWALLARCQSFLQAMEAASGRVTCPTCGTTIPHTLQAGAWLRCPGCGWECALRDYLDTIRNQQLNGGPEVVALFSDYTQKFPLAHDPAQKMLLVDQLIHGFHHYLTSGRTRRPVAVNLLAGDLGFVTDVLDRLSYGTASTPGLAETYHGWQAKSHPVKRKK